MIDHAITLRDLVLVFGAFVGLIFCAIGFGVFVTGMYKTSDDGSSGWGCILVVGGLLAAGFCIGKVL